MSFSSNKSLETYWQFEQWKSNENWSTKQKKNMGWEPIQWVTEVEELHSTWKPKGEFEYWTSYSRECMQQMLLSCKELWKHCEISQAFKTHWGACGQSSLASQVFRFNTGTQQISDYLKSEPYEAKIMTQVYFWTDPMLIRACSSFEGTPLLWHKMIS